MTWAVLLLLASPAASASEPPACSLRAIEDMIATAEPMPPYGPRPRVLPRVDIPAAGLKGFKPERPMFPLSFELPPEAQARTGIKSITKLDPLGNGGAAFVFTAEVTYLSGAKRIMAWKELRTREPLFQGMNWEVPPESLARERMGAELQHKATRFSEQVLPVEHVFHLTDADGHDLNLGILQKLGGRTLEKARDTQFWNLSPEDRLRLAETVANQLSSVLARLRRDAIVHQDVKPSNLLISGGTRNDLKDLLSGAARLELNDFGVAALNQRSYEGGAGTLSYLSPEYLASHVHQPANDLYAQGVILAELLGHVIPEPGLPISRVETNLLLRRAALPESLHDRFDRLKDYVLRCLGPAEQRPKEVFRAPQLKK